MPPDLSGLLLHAVDLLSRRATHRCAAGTEAAELESALGIPVLRHREKKPAGGSDDMERHFGYGSRLWARAHGMSGVCAGRLAPYQTVLDAVTDAPCKPLLLLLLLLLLAAGARRSSW